MKRVFNNLSFRSKIIWIFGLMFFISMAFSGVAYYRYTARDVENSFMVGAEDVLAQAIDTLELRFGAIRQRVQGMLSSYGFTVELVDYLNDPNDANKVKAMGTIAYFLKDLEAGERLIHSTYIYTEKGEFENFIRMRNWDFHFEESEFYQMYLDNPEKSIYWFSVREDEIFRDSDEVIPCVRRFSVEGYKGNQSYLVLQLKKSELDRILAGKYGYFDQLLILDRDGNLIAGSEGVDAGKLLSLEIGNASEEPVSAGDYELNGEAYLVFQGDITETGWKIFGLKSRESLLGSLKTLRYVILEITGAIFLLAVCSLLFVSGQMTLALRKLEKRMSCVQEGDFNVRYFYPYRDEVGSLAKSFNYMVAEIQELVQKQEETIQELKRERDRAAEIQKQKRKAELKALQAQINPHFLYNTLNAITWQAADQGEEEISILSSSLGKFFRISLSKGEEVISLREELEHVGSYLDIQSIRYRSRLRYELHAEEEWLDCRVLKLILQPLAENSIYHGIKEKSGAGLIRISVRRIDAEAGSVLELSVWDDGAGIPAKKLAAINDTLFRGEIRHSEGYGIYNVNERIRLYFGENCGLSYESEEGLWTRAVLTLPAEKLGG